MKLFENNARQYTVTVDALLKQLFVDDALLTAPDFDRAKLMLNQLIE